MRCNAHRLDGHAELPDGVEDLELFQAGAEVVGRQLRPRGGEPRVLARLARRDSRLGVHGEQLRDEVLNKKKRRENNKRPEKKKWPENTESCREKDRDLD